MELPHSKTRQAYIEQISVVEANLKEATSGAIDRALLSQVQKRLDTLAGKYQYNEEIGTARYKLYELQALVHFFKGDDDTALDFINQAIETRGDSYSRAEKLKAQILKKVNLTKRYRRIDRPRASHHSNCKPLLKERGRRLLLWRFSRYYQSISVRGLSFTSYLRLSSNLSGFQAVDLSKRQQ